MSMNNLSHEDQCELLLSELVVFELLAKILLKYPDKEFIKQILDSDLFSSIPYSKDQPSTIEGLELLSNWEQENGSRQEMVILGDLRTDYTGLFLNTGGSKISPWESVYLGEARSLFQENTLIVRNWYRRFGLQIENIYKEPDDHIGLELSFLSHLARLGFSALEERDIPKFEEILNAKKQFLEEHPLKWTLIWTNQVQEYARTDFYRGIALVTRGAILELASTLEINHPAGWD